MKMLACCRVAVVSRTCVSEGGNTEAFSLAFVPPVPLFLARSDANCIHGVILSTSFSFSLSLSKARSVRARMPYFFVSHVYITFCVVRLELWRHVFFP